MFVQHLLQPVLVLSGTPVPDSGLVALIGPKSPYVMLLLQVGLSTPIPLKSRPHFFNSRCIEMSFTVSCPLGLCLQSRDIIHNCGSYGYAINNILKIAVA